MRNLIYTFHIPTHPVSKKNSRPIYRHKGKPFIGKSKKLQNYEKLATLVLQKQKARITNLPFNLPVGVILTHYTIHRMSDLSNLGEAVMDCLQSAGILRQDNIKAVRSITNNYGGHGAKTIIQVSIPEFT